MTHSKKKMQLEFNLKTEREIETLIYSFYEHIACKTYFTFDKKAPVVQHFYSHLRNLNLLQSI